MLNGRVKWFNNAKGFGIIMCNGEEYFVHFTEIVGEGFKTLVQGSPVNFVPSSGPRGLVATKVSQNASDLLL